MIIRVAKRSRGWTAISNETLQDDHLSWKATGMLAYLLSLPDDWRVNRDDLETRKSDGMTVVRSTMTELTDAGYLVRRRERLSNGTFQTILEVHESPVEVEEVVENLTSGGGKPDRREDRRGETQPSLLVPSTDDPDRLPSGEISRAKADNPFFEVFWQSYPKRNGVRVGKVATQKEWAKLKPEERAAAAAGVETYARAMGSLPQDPERYLRHKRWVGIEVDSPGDRDQRVIEGATRIAEFLNVKEA